MPLFVLVMIRLGRAVMSVYSVLFDADVRRAVPWAYVRRLPREHVWVGLTTVTVSVGLGAVLLTLVLPLTGATHARTAGFVACAVGIGASALRMLPDLARRL